LNCQRVTSLHLSWLRERLPRGWAHSASGAELPAINKDEVKVSAENGVLSISDERKTEQEEKGKKYHRTEQSYGTFIRSFILPEGTSSDKISAEFRHGLLKVHVPKDEKAKPKAIDVKVG
jgi:HSP20 family protein